MRELFYQWNYVVRKKYNRSYLVNAISFKQKLIPLAFKNVIDSINI